VSFVNDDSQLIDAALAGQTAAFGHLVRKYQDRLYNAVVHVLGCAEEARDVVQDAFVQAYLKLDSFQRTAAFYTWLYRIAFNLAVSRRRKHRPTESIDRNREATGDEPADPAPATDRLEQEERAQQVRRALAMLSDEHRVILVLRDVDGCSYDGIAEILDLPVGTVRSRIHRARMQLREQLKEVLQEELD
jgi:RNA polymerase sigma-70 factor (ECF subfamily)